MATILLVDDYTPNHRLLGYVLGQDGHAVITASDGLQALECLATTTVDLLVTDLTMPRMDGLALARKLRVDRRYAALPIIMLTASVKERDAARAASEGIDVFLTKPVDSDDLTSVVSRLLKQRPEVYGPPAMLWRTV